MQERFINLFCTEGGSDKVYNLQMKPDGDGWRIFFQNGARGKALRSGEKTKAPISYEAANKEFDKIVRSKMGGGYRGTVDGVAYSSSEFAGRRTSFRPQLLNAMTREQGDDVGPDWLAQEKHDGERRGVDLDESGRIVFSNRKGLEVDVNSAYGDAIALTFETASWVDGAVSLDTEDMGDHLVVFDVPAWPGMPKDAPFRERAMKLIEIEAMIHSAGTGGIIKVDRPMPLSEFRLSRLPEIIARGGEGYVVRDPDASYEPGRPATGGGAFKIKFTESASCRVAQGRDGRRSVGIELLDAAGDWVSVGNVTIPLNAGVPEVGDIIEVEYLYARDGGALIQPVYLGVRGDLGIEACVVSQLKFRGEGMFAEAPVEPESDAAPGW